MTRWTAIALCLVLTAGCKAGPTGTKPATTGAKALSSDVARLLLSTYGAGILSNAGAGVSGVVRGPASLISNNGGSIISNNGGSLISNNGGSLGRYRLSALAAEDAVPAAGRKVRLLDAAGAPVLDAKKHPIETTTDSQGRYRFAGEALPEGNLRVAIALDAGALEAMVPQGQARGTVDVDLASTVTTSYIVDRFVAGRDQPQAIYNKLPAVLEARARDRARAALAAKADALSALDRGAIDAAVDGLRSGDAALDATLETIEAVMLAAGQANLGAGSQGTSVRLDPRSSWMAVTDTGRLYVYSRSDARVWRLNDDGSLSTALGNGARGQDGPIDGQRGDAVAITYLEGLCPDGHGGLLVLAGLEDFSTTRANTLHGLRIGPDGIVHELGTITKQVVGLAADAEGNPSMLVHDGAQDACYRFVKNGVEISSRLAPDALPLGVGNRLAVDRAGKLVLGEIVEGGTLVLDPGSGQVSRVDQATLASVEGGGEPVEVAAPDGTRYAFADGRVTRSRGGVESAVIGLAPGGATTGASDDLAIGEPSGLAVMPSGDFVVADYEDAALYAVSMAGRVAKHPASDTLDHPALLRADATGNLFVLEHRLPVMRIRKLAPDGTLSDAYLPADTTTHLEGGGLGVKPGDRLEGISDFRIGPDGTTYLAVFNILDQTGRIVRKPPNGAEETLMSVRHDGGVTLAIALGEKGLLYILDASKGEGTLSVWSAGKGVLKATRDSRLASLGQLLSASSDVAVEVDHRGRLYVSCASRNNVQRFDPMTGAFTTIAGKGAAHFGGTGVDDGLDMPGYVTLDAQGNVIFSDMGHRQVKRVPAGEL